MMRNLSLAVCLSSALAITACSSAVSSWSPKPYPSAQADGFSLPASAYEFSASISLDGDLAYEASGILETNSEGACALDIDFADTPIDAPRDGVTGEVVKAFGETGFVKVTEPSDSDSSASNSEWFDINSPNNPVGTVASFASPLYMIPASSPNTTSWCFLTALPSFTNMSSTGDTETQYDWNLTALADYVGAQTDSLAWSVSKMSGLSTGQTNELAQRLSFSPEEFANVKFSPLIAKDDRGAVSLSYSIGERGQVSISLTPLSEVPTISTPTGATSWDYNFADLPPDLREGIR